MISCSILALAASSLAIDGWGQDEEMETDASPLPDELAGELAGSAETDDPAEAADQERGRRPFREARRQATLERIRSARQEPGATPPATALAGIDLSFRLPRDAHPGGAWIAPPIDSGLQEGDFTVEARVAGRNAKGEAVAVTPQWIAADPATVEVSPAEGDAVKITVRGSGESNLTVAAPGFSTELWISATHQGKALQVRIFQ